MTIYEYLQLFSVNIFAIILLGALYLIMKSRGKNSIENYSKKILRLLVTLNIIALVVELITWITRDHSLWSGYYRSYMSYSLLILLKTSLACMWLSYVDYKIFKDRRRLMSRYYYMYGVLFVLVLLVVNLVTPLFFSVNQTTFEYTNGPLMWIIHLTSHLAYAFSIVFVVKNRKNLDSTFILLSILCLLFPMMGAIIQSFYTNLFFGLSMMSFALLMAYFLLETTESGRDYLTKLYNRQSFEDYVDEQIKENNDFTFILIDLNNFKAINDTYGHAVGDMVLVEFSRALEKAFAEFGVVARLSGDEFIILYPNVDLFQIDVSIEKLKNLLKESKNPRLQSLTFSCGKQPSSKGMSYDEIYISVDTKMYEDKINNKKSFSLT